MKSWLDILHLKYVAVHYIVSGYFQYPNSYLNNSSYLERTNAFKL
jgi:hypothetical protein